MRYLALDFETSCSQRSSICAIGYALFEDDKLIEHGNHFCKPEPYIFNEVNVSVNGITRSMVFNSPPASYFLNRLVHLDFNYYVCHNAEFDMSCLLEISKLQGFVIPEKQVICSMFLTSRILNSGYISLGPLCKFLNIALNHHDAGSDAMACGLLFQRCINNNFANIDNIFKEFKYFPGLISSSGYTPVTYEKAKRPSYGSFAPSPSEVNKMFANPINKNFEKVSFVFTGQMDAITRAEAMIEVWKRSGKVTSNTTLKTNYVVIGNEIKEQIAKGEFTSKVQKAYEYNKEKGTDIKIINESSFIEMISR